MEETFMKLDGKVAGMFPQKGGGTMVVKPGGMSIADFMQDGTVITREEYIKAGGYVPSEEDLKKLNK